jgi:hypothetical protein
MDTLAVVTPGDGDPTQLVAQARQLYGRAAYTHKTHEKQADICHLKYLRQRGWLVALTAISSGTFVTSLVGVALDKQWAALVTSFIALAVTATNLGTKNFKYGEQMQQHRDTAAKIWDVRESYLSLLVDLQSGGCRLEEAATRRNALQASYGATLSDAPRTTPKAYAQAQDALKNKEDLTLGDDEIDRMLPSKLRRGEGQPE